MAGLYLGGERRGGHVHLRAYMDGAELGRLVVPPSALEGLAWALDAVIAVDADAVAQRECDPAVWLVGSEDVAAVDDVLGLGPALRITLRHGEVVGHRTLAGEWQATPAQVDRLVEHLPRGRFTVKGPLLGAMIPGLAS